MEMKLLWLTHFAVIKSLYNSELHYKQFLSGVTTAGPFHRLNLNHAILIQLILLIVQYTV